MHGYIDFTGQICEARVRVGTTFEQCGKPAEAIVDHPSDRCLRPMCGGCALDDVENRGSSVISATAELAVRLLPKPVDGLRVVRSQHARGGFIPAPAFLGSGSLGRWKARTRYERKRLHLVGTKG